jgi:hypothetical protein
MTTAIKQPELSARTRHGRAVNAVAEFLRSNLTVPNIYLEPRAFAASMIDVLAVDRAGAGDLHGVEIKTDLISFSTVSAHLRFYAVRRTFNPAHYRYIALPKSESLLRLLPKLDLFSRDGIGRTGILLISQQNDDLPLVEIGIKPERYRVLPAPMEKVDRFLARNRPDIEVRI